MTELQLLTDETPNCVQKTFDVDPCLIQGETDILAFLEELGEIIPSSPESELLEHLPSSPTSPQEIIVPNSPLPSPNRPAVPSSSINPACSPINPQLRHLYPLSGAGFLYNFAPTSIGSVPPTHFIPMPTSSMVIYPHETDPYKTPLDIPASASIASRKEKLEKYRQKRSKRNFNKPADEAKRERALSRPRDEFGHFNPGLLSRAEQAKLLTEMEQMKKQLYLSQSHSFMLLEKMRSMEQQVTKFKQIAENVSASQADVRKALERQQLINQTLLKENRMLWQTVPINETFNTIRPDFPYAEPFKEKIDLSEVELNWTDSPILEAVSKDLESEEKWQEMLLSTDQQGIY